MKDNYADGAARERELEAPDDNRTSRQHLMWAMIVDYLWWQNHTRKRGMRIHWRDV